MNTDSSLVCFKAISNFTSELVELFSKHQRSLQLYGRLINKTTIVNDKPIKKHIEAFRSFCVSNREAIISKSVAKLTVKKIEYSRRVYIDMKEIFDLSDKETSKVIWEHLLCISALVDPSGNAREILKKHLENGNAGDSETNFLTDIIDKVESSINPNASPMEAVSSVMQSGIFTDLIGGMNNGLSNGTLDIGKLMGAVQGMVSQLGEKTGGNSQTDGAMNMLNSMMSNMSTNNEGVPDLSEMMQGMMSGLSNSINTPENESKLSSVTENENESDKNK